MARKDAHFARKGRKQVSMAVERSGSGISD